MEIHHFGDSYCLTNIGPNFCQIMAENIEYQYSLYGVRGYSNEQILNSIIKNLHKFKSGDKIFINFSFFTRGCWYDNKTKSEIIEQIDTKYKLQVITKDYIILNPNIKILL